jgi:DNA-binding MarR family transcriptional regulator
LGKLVRVSPNAPSAAVPTRTPDVVGPVDTTEIAARLRLSATRLARRLRQEADAALTPSQLSALASIEHRGPLTLGALADCERVARPSVTKLVAKLVAAGLVTRRLDEHDGRVAWVALTPTGRTRLAQIRQRKTAWLAARLARFDDEQRRCITDALDALDALTVDTR